MGIWVKYNHNYFYFCPFWGIHLQVRPVDGFLRMMAQKTQTRAKMCLFGDFFSNCSHLGIKISQTPIFGTWIGIFMPNSRNRKTCILSKLLHRFQPDVAQLHSNKDHKMPFVVGSHTRITNPRWRTAAVLKKNEKLLYLSRGSSDFDEIWHSDVVRSSWPFQLLKNLKFRKLMMAVASNLKNRKLTYLRRGLSDFDKI